MRWTQTVPTAKGFYWCWNDHYMMILEVDEDGIWPLGAGHPITLAGLRLWFYGPVEPPAPPGDA